jgi:subtilisin family serine protease
MEIDFDDSSPNAIPKNIGEDHGTSCAGVAAGIGILSPGVAPGCSLMLSRMGNIQSLSDTAKMFSWMAKNGADVISVSWGPPDRAFWLGEPSVIYELDDNVREAVNFCVTQGREGKGCSICWAAGNGDEPVSNDGYASNPDVIAVAASTSPDTNGKESRSYYSDYGPEIWICAPSSGNSRNGEKGIFTTDRLGDFGYNPLVDGQGNSTPFPNKDYTDAFGGTSSATPFVAGVIGLMLSMNPKLNATQIKDIIKQTADRIGDGNSYKPDQSGLLHSELFGYGRINAYKAIIEAKNLVTDDTAERSTAETSSRGMPEEHVDRNSYKSSFTSKKQDEMHWRRYH